MSELIIPIAISSELDVTGEERIHVAVPNPITRPVYVPTPIVPSSVTWNPADKSAQLNLSNGDLTADVIGATFNTFRTVRATGSRTTGKYYHEVRINNGTEGADRRHPVVGWHKTGVPLETVGADVNSVGINKDGELVQWPAPYQLPWTSEILIGEWWMLALDLDSGKGWIGKEGVWLNGGDPAAGTNPTFTGITGPITPAVSLVKYLVQADSITGMFRYDWWSWPAPTGFGQW